KITIEQCDNWADILAETDAKLGTDPRSHSFCDKVNQILVQLDNDKQPKPQDQEPSLPPPSVVQHVVYRNDSEAQIKPFDGSPCHYRQFERLYESKYESDSSYREADKFIIFRNLIGEKG